MFNDLAVIIYYIQGTLWANVKIDGAKPGIFRRQEFLFFKNTPGTKRCALCTDPVYMDQIVARFGNKSGVLVKRSRESAAQVIRNATGRSDDPHIGQQLVIGFFGDGKNLTIGAMIGNTLICFSYQKLRIVLEITGAQYFLINVVSVFGEEVSSPGVKGLAKLGLGRQRFHFVGIGFKAYVPIVGVFAQTCSLGMVRKTNLTTFIGKFFTNRGGKRPLVRQINPVVESKHGVVEVVLRIGERKPSEHDFAHICAVVTIGICQVVYVGRVGNQNAIPPAHQTGRQE